jgi:hypothetical protein
MKKFIKENWFKSIIVCFLLCVNFFVIFPTLADVYVKGYTKKNGTYVAPHYRSDPDGIKSNNWSYPGNTNPHTGVTAGGNVNTILSNPTLIKTLPIKNITDINFSNKQKGKFFLQVEDGGRIWWVNPGDGKRYEFKLDNYLEIMRNKSTGITNNDLNKIPVGN